MQSLPLMNCTIAQLKNECWMNGLLKNGLYYERIVSSVDDILELYKRQTVTTWGTRTSFYLESDKAASSNPRSENNSSKYWLHIHLKCTTQHVPSQRKEKGGSHSM